MEGRPRLSSAKNEAVAKRREKGTKRLPPIEIRLDSFPRLRPDR
jgi:hypothetical protein